MMWKDIEWQESPDEEYDYPVSQLLTHKTKGGCWRLAGDYLTDNMDGLALVHWDTDKEQIDTDLDTIPPRAGIDEDEEYLTMLEAAVLLAEFEPLPTEVSDEVQRS